jgi:hypothetical protein
MLTARGPFAAMRSSGGQWIMAALVGGALLAVLLQTVVHLELPRDAGVVADERPPETGSTTTQLGMGLLGVRTDLVSQTHASPALVAGTPGYLLVFEIISVHLLVVMVGAAYLARAKRRVPRESPPPITEN